MRIVASKPQPISGFKQRVIGPVSCSNSAPAFVSVCKDVWRPNKRLILSERDETLTSSFAIFVLVILRISYKLNVYVNHPLSGTRFYEANDIGGMFLLDAFWLVFGMVRTCGSTFQRETFVEAGAM